MQLILVRDEITMDYVIAPSGVVGNPWNLQLYAAGLILCIRNILAGTYTVLT
jgi:hypothetical protein